MRHFSVLGVSAERFQFEEERSAPPSADARSDTPAVTDLPFDRIAQPTQPTPAERCPGVGYNSRGFS
jgi:hypothetical protein